jgi:hypothetical protein
MRKPSDLDPYKKPAEEWLADHDLIGLAEADAKAMTSAASLRIRVTARDGVGFPRRADFRSNRVNVEVNDGRVSRIGGVY